MWPQELMQKQRCNYAAFAGRKSILYWLLVQLGKKGQSACAAKRNGLKPFQLEKGSVFNRAFLFFTIPRGEKKGTKNGTGYFLHALFSYKLFVIR